MRSFLILLFLGVGAAGTGCHGGVDHPPPNEPNEPEYCADRAPEENNCMACSSQPGCGWCDTPAAGQPSCQAGADHESPETCSGGWAFSTEACAPPPPPPPIE